MFLSGWLVLWVDHPVLPKLKGTAIGAFPLQEIAGNFYGAAGARRDPEQPCTGRFTGPKRVPAPG